MPPTLEAWDLATEPITERSRLYCLEPIGIGTAFVESLSGYAERLAAAHAVSAGNLIGRELFVRPAGTNRINVGLVSYAVNGVGGSAKRWVHALEAMTSRPDLRCLTLLPFERLLPQPFLFRPFRVWCPACYELMASQGGPVYEPLLWCLKLVGGLSLSPSILDENMPSLPPISATLDRSLAAGLLLPVRAVVGKHSAQDNSSVLRFRPQ